MIARKHFKAAAGAAALLFSAAAMAVEPDTNARQPGGSGPGRGLFLLLYAEPLKTAAETWAAYRAAGGWQVITRAVEPGPDDDARRAQVAGVIRERFQAWRDTPPKRQQPSESSAADDARFVVLLLGDATPIAAAGPGVNDGIPTWRLPQTEPTIRDKRDPFYATDDPYQELDADALPDVALGRVPARSSEEALALLDKIKAYETDRAPGPWRRRVVFVAGEGHFGMIDLLLEGLFKQMVERFVPDEFEVSMTYAKGGSMYCPPPSKLKPIVLARLGEGALLFNYIGHGHPTGVDSLHWAGKRIGIMEAGDLAGLACAGVGSDATERTDGREARLPEPGAGRPIALMTCCSTGWYDLPEGKRCLAESLLFHPCGPVAVIAGSRPTHPYANALHQKNVTQLLLKGGAPTVGELDLLASRELLEPDETDRQLEALTQPLAMAMKWRSSTAQLRAMHVGLYNLLGDPATVVARPAAAVTELVIEGSKIHGVVRGMTQGRARISLETARTAIADPQALAAVEGDDDPKLEKKAARNYPLANQRVLGEVQTQVIDGRFEASLDGLAINQVAVVRVYVVGRGESGAMVDGFGAVRARRAEQASP